MRTKHSELKSFQDENRSISETILDMDRAGDDPAKQTPKDKIEINEVGIRELEIPMNVSAQPIEGWNISHGTISILFGVPATQRGVHLSRMASIASECGAYEFKSLTEMIEYAGRRSGEIHDGIETKVSLSAQAFRDSELEVRPDSSAKRSLDSVCLRLEKTVRGTEQLWTTGLHIAHITSCPCVQNAFKHLSGTLVDGSPLGVSHSQRTVSKALISDIRPQDFDKLYVAVADVVKPVQTTLPREYELDLVYQSHKEPAFIEDATRAILISLSKIEGVRDTSRFFVESVSQESIHPYDIVATASAFGHELQS